MKTKHANPFSGLKSGSGTVRLIVTILTAVLIVTAIGSVPAYAKDAGAHIARSSEAPRSDPHANPGAIHIVRRGDTLWGLARRYGTTVRAIMRANGLRSTRIYVGQRLNIPVRPPTPGTVYVVRRGDTLYRLALRFGTTVRAIMQANSLHFFAVGLERGNELAVGDLPQARPVPRKRRSGTQHRAIA